jgi:NAD(P)-dependent dehydrogenase (short-subunit alcohol dehydrogenase family)
MSTQTTNRIALITGVGRAEGIGFEVSRQLGKLGMTVLLTARKAEAAQTLAAQLRNESLDIHGLTLDVTSDDSVRQLADDIAAKWGHLDILINNAAGTSAYGEKPSAANLVVAHDVFETTLFGAWRTTQALMPLLRKSTACRIVNVSSGAGSHGDPFFGLNTANSMGPSYAVAKAALNALTATLAQELKSSGMLVNAVDPGFTATFPGGESMGARPVSEGAASIVWATLLPDDGPTGGFFRDGKPLAW